MELNLSCKQNEKLQKYDLVNLSKEELINKLLISDAHNNQLRNIIKKQKSFNSNSNNKIMKRKRKDFDFTRHHFRHILLHFYYLGWDYQGFVVQEDTSNTIEHYLFEALVKTCLIKNRETSNYHRCGRTDKGVSSFGQTISLNIRSKLNKDNEDNINDELNYCKMLNSVLPNNIQCIGWCPVPNDFSARFQCSSRTYKYFFPKGYLNIIAMQQSLTYLVGIHDFRNLCKMDVANGVVTYIRRIFEAHIEKCEKNQNDSVDVELEYDMFVLTIKGQAFLWHQIRCIIAVLFLIGENKETPEVIRELLDVTKCPRKPNYNLAKDLPLNLFHCQYNDIDNWVYDQSNLSHVISILQKQWTYSSVKCSMMKTMLDELEKKIPCKNVDNKLTSCLLEGVDSKIYKPLMSRQKCNALDDRIQHYAKKKKKL